VSFLDHLHLEAGSFYVMDRGYLHFARLAKFNDAAAFFVTRAKAKLHYRVVATQNVDDTNGVVSDRRIVMTGRYTGVDYPMVIRSIEYEDPETSRRLTFLTNNFALDAASIAALYKARWQVELFFKWIKQHLRIKSFVGNTANAVKIQVWTAITAYVLVAMVKKHLNVAASLNSMLQILSLNLFEKTTLADLLSEAANYEESASENTQISLL
jgi:IS4 transposase